MQVDKHTKRRFNVDDVQLVTFDRPPAQGGRSRVALSPIDQKYQQLSRSQDVLGYATSQEQDAPDGRGRFRLYQHGVIYYTSRSDAHVVTGPIRDQWASLGYERSELGYPTSDEIAAPDGGRMQYFEHGIVIWNSQDGAVVEISTADGRPNRR